MFPLRPFLMDPDPAAAPATGAPPPTATPPGAPPAQGVVGVQTQAAPTTPPDGSLASLVSPPKGGGGGSDTVYAVPMDDGTTRYVTLEQLADAYVTQVGFDPKDAEAGRLLKKALGGDAAATQELTRIVGGATLVPTTANPLTGLSASNPSGQPAAPAQPGDSALQQRIDQLEKQLKAVSGITSNIQALSHEARVKRDIVSHANELPFASQHPGAAQKIINEVNRIEQTLHAAGQRTDNKQVAQQIYARAMLNVEEAIRTEHSIYGSIKIAPPATPVNNDQGTAGTLSPQQAAAMNGRNPEGIVVLGNGQVIDKATGLPVRQLPTGELQIVTAPAPTGGGMPVMADQAAAFTGPPTLDTLRARTKARLAQLQAQKQGANV